MYTLDSFFVKAWQTSVKSDSGQMISVAISKVKKNVSQSATVNMIIYFSINWIFFSRQR